MAHQVWSSAQALADRRARRAPNSDSADDLREYVQHPWTTAALTSLIESPIGYTPSIYEVTIVDRSGNALISSDASLPGRQIP